MENALAKAEPAATPHQLLERLLSDLCEQAKTDDRLALRRCWTRLEREVTKHLRSEESALIPAFAAAHPEEAAVLLGEHGEIRRRLDDLGIAVDLHMLDVSIAEELARLLRRHAEHEERVLYLWVAEHV
jgi:hypothetical protein